MKDLNFKRVVFVSDLMRPFKIGSSWESATWKNIRWLSHMLKMPMKNQGIPTFMMSWDTGYSRESIIDFDAPSIYRDLDLDINYESWAKFIKLEKSPDIYVEKIKSLEGSLVIGYELPEIMTAALNDLKIPFIDIVLHPIRFMPDLIFGFHSNVKKFQTVFEKFKFNDADIYSAAEEIRAKATWMQQPKLKFKPGAALILGQVAYDRAAVLGDGKFASLDQYLSKLHDLSEQYSEIYFKPHPYQADLNSYSEILKYFPSIKLIKSNMYNIFCQQELIKVVALNSSGLIEAGAFGIDAENFIPYLYDFRFENWDVINKNNKWIPLGNCWLYSDFWSQVFNDSDIEFFEIEKNKFSDVNRLRKSMNADWGWGEIDKVIA